MVPARGAPRTRSLTTLTAGLVLAVTAVATGSIFARQSDLDPLSKAGWRCGIAALILLGPALRSGGWRALPLGRSLLAGCLLGLHFGSWLWSLDHTSVAVSVLLVNTTPLWVAALSQRVNGEGVSPGARVGLGLGLIGALGLPLAEALLTPEGPSMEGALGPGLALVGALGWAGYTLAGRGVVREAPLVTYLCLCYGVAAATLGLTAVALGRAEAPVGLEEWTPVLGLALVPQLVGHSLLNWALQSLSAVMVSIAALGEPLVASCLAWLLLGEVPGTPVLLAAPVVALGVLTVARAEQRT